MIFLILGYLLTAGWALVATSMLLRLHQRQYQALLAVKPGDPGFWYTMAALETCRWGRPTPETLRRCALQRSEYAQPSHSSVSLSLGVH